MSRLLNRVPRRIATLSVHTSPLDQPGTGDAGGLNVYVVEVAKRLAALGTEVEIFTRAVCRDTPPLAELVPGVLVRSVVAGPFEELDKAELPGHVCQFTHEVLRAEAAAEPGRYDLVHAHYWLSGKVGAAVKKRWGMPLVQSMHTLGKVKNASLAAGDAAEPAERIRGELEVVTAADRLIANTAEEARQLTELYGADPAKVEIVNPGADLSVFCSAGPEARSEARHRLGIAPDAVVLLFVGRVQPLKGPDIALKAAARLVAAEPSLRRRLRMVLVGGPSGRQQRADPEGMRELASLLGISDIVRFEPPCPQSELAEWYRAATAVLTPSHSESFGLVALEAQACGTPVVAARVGGLRTVVKDGHSGVLVDGHDPADWARVIRRLIQSPRQLELLSQGARQHAAAFGWSATVDRLTRVYTGAMEGAVLSPAARVGALPGMPADDALPSAPGDALGAALDSLGVAYERPEPDAYLVRLEGQHKLATMTWLIAGQHSLQVEAFFCRQPDENHAAFYRFLLERGARMYGVHFALDAAGDVYLTGRLPLAAISEPEIDRLLGCVLAYCDETFNEALKIGFASAIRREWAWREKRGESLANLRPFEALATDRSDTKAASLSDQKESPA